MRPTLSHRGVASRKRDRTSVGADLGYRLESAPQAALDAYSKRYKARKHWDSAFGRVGCGQLVSDVLCTQCVPAEIMFD